MDTLKRVTMREIAAAANVSTMTVSLALRNSQQIGQETKVRVLGIAKKLGYTPDPALSALLAYRAAKKPSKFRGSIAYINHTDQPESHRRIRLHREYFNGAHERATELGFTLEEFWTAEPGMTPERATQILSCKEVSGLLIGPMPEAHGQLDLKWEQFTGVAFGFSLESPRLSTVSTHNFQCVRLAVESILERGYSRIGMAITRGPNDRVLRAWSGAFLEQQNTLIKKKDRIPILETDHVEPDRFRRWFLRHRPDALLLSYRQALTLLEKMGIRVGEDVGVAFPFKEDVLPGFAHVDQNCFFVGRTAIEVLSGQIYRNEKGIPEHRAQTLIDGGWRDGLSLPRRN